MFSGKVVLFQRTRELNAKITEFLNNISESSLLFSQACDSYMEKGVNEDFDTLLNKVAVLEARNDQLRRTIEAQLYEHTLIPESRADVLQLLEGTDKIINLFESRLYQLSIEKIYIYDNLKPMYSELVESAIRAVEALIRSVRAFFTNPNEVSHHLHKVMFFEKQGDMASTKLKRMIFDNENDELSHKIQLRMLCDDIDSIADISEDIADSLSIFAIKRDS
jgi:predicted phosphate transport protein (TIGR00153 family)